MTQISTIRSLLDQWPTRKDLADDIECSVDRIHKWVRSGSIPARFHGRVMRSAADRGITVSAETMIALHDKTNEAA